MRSTEGEVLEAIDKFMYLDGILSKSVNTDNDVDTHITNASSAFGQLS